MSRAAKIWLITAGILVVLGPAMIVGALAANGFDMTKLGAEAFETNTYEPGATFDQIAVDVKTTDVSFAPAEGDQCTVVCEEPEEQHHTVEVRDGVLTLRSTDTRGWQERLFRFSFRSPKMTVFLPQKAYDSLAVVTETGDIAVPDDFTFGTLKIDGRTSDVRCAAAVREDVEIQLSTGDLQLSGVTSEAGVTVKTSTGDVSLTDIACRDLEAECSTGNINMNNVIAGGAFRLHTSTGNVSFTACDAGEIFVRTSTGDVTGTLLSPKQFATDTDTGTVNLPPYSTGGRCEISTSTGDIRIGIAE